jgi:hypothetical protein
MLPFNQNDENKSVIDLGGDVNDKGFIRFAAQKSREAKTTDAANVMKPLSELNGESSLAL